LNARLTSSVYPAYSQREGDNVFGALVAIKSEVENFVRLKRSVRELKHVMEIRAVLLSPDGTCMHFRLPNMDKMEGGSLEGYASR